MRGRSVRAPLSFEIEQANFLENKLQGYTDKASVLFNLIDFLLESAPSQDRNAYLLNEPINSRTKLTTKM